MKRPDFSPEQRLAIDTPGCVIVSAGAGSGKTTVMIERIVKKLVAGARLDDMLIVTFTRAAASDIRVKLAERLTELRRDDRLHDIATEAILALPVCNIGTLHSFCQRLIRTYFYAAGIDPAASVFDEGEAKRTLRACVKAAVESARDSGDERFCELCDALSTRRDDTGAENAVISVLDFALSLSDPEGYLRRVASDRTFDADLDSRFEVWYASLKERITELVRDLEPTELKSVKKAAGELLPYIDVKLDEISRTAYRGSDDRAGWLYDRFKSLRSECALYRDNVDALNAIKSVDTLPYVSALSAVALDALARYNKRKTALGRVDYSDLEHGAYRVLSDSKCLSELSGTVKYVFIDEYQDVNPLQADIAEKLKNGAGAEMFLVGDVKQSIYGFRRCDPKFFRAALVDPDYTHIMLNNNYRSSRAVVDFVNGVFDGVMDEGFGGVDYSSERLVCNRDDVGAAALYAIPRPQKQTVERKGVYSVKRSACDGEPPDPQAVFVVNAILDYIAEREPDGRQRRYGDIAVLVRSARSAFCDRLIRLMRSYGIPCDRGRKSSVSDYTEVAALISIARYVDNRFDDVALYTALRSPMGGFSDSELLSVAEAGEAALRRAGEPALCGLARKTYYFWQKVSFYDGPLKDRLDAFLARRDDFCEYAMRHDAADTLGYITSRIDYFQYVFENGGSAAAVEALIADAAAYKPDLGGYLAALDGDRELKVGDGGDAVTVSTIHAAKGLEYDFCIVADASHRINMRDMTARVIPTDAGIAIMFPDAERRTLVESVPHRIATREIPGKLREEALRLFYVALTRAKRFLAVCGYDSDRRDPTEAASEFDFTVNILPTPADVTPRELGVSSTPPALRGAITAAVSRACEFVYPHVVRPIKTCVTALANEADDQTSTAPVITDDDAPRMELATGDPRLRGTAYHRAMELIDFDAPDLDAVRDIDNAELVDFDRILHAAKVMKELAAGGACLKERYFIADLPQDNGSVLVQGVIDLIITDGAGNAIIVDYKTTAPDRLINAGYETQLALYAAAVERTSPLKVTKKYLYSFVTGELIPM